MRWGIFVFVARQLAASPAGLQHSANHHQPDADADASAASRTWSPGGRYRRRAGARTASRYLQPT